MSSAAARCEPDRVVVPVVSGRQPGPAPGLAGRGARAASATGVMAGAFGCCQVPGADQQAGGRGQQLAEADPHQRPAGRVSRLAGDGESPGGGAGHRGKTGQDHGQRSHPAGNRTAQHPGGLATVAASPPYPAMLITAAAVTTADTRRLARARRPEPRPPLPPGCRRCCRSPSISSRAAAACHRGPPRTHPQGPACTRPGPRRSAATPPAASFTGACWRQRHVAVPGQADRSGPPHGAGPATPLARPGSVTGLPGDPC
jgi:hypothetical protein